MKAVVAAFNQEKVVVGAFSVITNLRMELFEALHSMCGGNARRHAPAGELGRNPGTRGHGALGGCSGLEMDDRLGPRIAAMLDAAGPGTLLQLFLPDTSPLGRDCDIRAALGAVGIYLVVFLLSDLTLSPS